MRKYLVALSGAVLLGAGASDAQAQVTVGSVDSGNCYPYSCGPTDSVTRYQQGFRSGVFSGPLTFNQLIYTVWSGFNPGTDFDTGTYSVDFYYSANPFNSLSTSLTSNLGASIGSFGNFSLGGPAGSSLVLDGSTLTYDPTFGDLLVDVNVTGGTSVNGAYNVFFNADYTGSDTTRAWSSTVFGDTSTTGALVTTFNLTASGVPEPASWALMLLGFGIAGAAMRRQRQRATLQFA
jgi:hypothetical protein